MRKVDPNGVIDDFQSQVADSLEGWSVLADVLLGKPVALRRKVASDSFLTIAVAWESFLADWWVGAINRDAETYLKTTEHLLRQNARNVLGLGKSDLAVKLVLKTHLGVDEIRDRLDAQGRNLVIHGHQERQQRAKADLANPYRSKAHAIPEREWQTVECVRSLRNFLAHRSTSAAKEFDKAVRNENLKEELRWAGERKLKVMGAMRYLATKRECDAELRVARFHAELSSLAERLRVA